MTAQNSSYDDPLTSALLRGRREGLAIAAVTVGCVAFVNLLGAEKAILAVVLGSFALRGLPAGIARGRALTAIGLGAAHVAILLTLLTLYHEAASQLIQYLKDLA